MEFSHPRYLDPVTGAPFPGNAHSGNARISPQAQAY